ncbi:MAG: DUF3473 domain-containing protein [Verrucomicrobia bacterium]|nr:DUF3473 domain-containing protein [Verrucomicrobiota bacterium]
MKHILTVDFEEWFCVSNFEKAIGRESWASLESRIEAQTRALLDLFDRRQTHATFFILGWVGERHPALLKEIALRGHELASHGYAHDLVHRLTPEAFREDLERGLRAVEEATGQRCAGYRAPSFSLRRSDTWAWETLAAAGIRYDSSVFPVIHDRYGEPEAPRAPFTVSVGDRAIREFPLSTVRVGGRHLPVAGGGYLRLYPLGVTRWAIRRLEAEGLSAIVYLHPWEVDPEQPIPPAHWLRVWRHRVGMKTLINKLDSLLTTFSFVPFREIL